MHRPGADLNAIWYLKNEDFRHARQTGQFGDRILVVYSAGHNYWLRHLVENAPGCQVVDVRPYLAPPDQVN